MRFLSAMMLSVLASGCIGFCGGGGDPGTSSEASIYVTDSQGQPIESPHFSENGVDVSSSCGETDANQSCLYDILFLAQGAHSITVSADGFRSEVVSVDTTSTDSVHLAVALSRTSKLLQIEQIVRK